MSKFMPPGSYVKTVTHNNVLAQEPYSKFINDGFEYISLDSLLLTHISDVQGYHSLSTNYYYTGGLATDTVIDAANVNTWVDVLLTVDPLGNLDNRIASMKEASAAGFSGTGAAGDPVKFELVGLTDHAHGSLRAALSFNPEVDEGRLEARVLFSRHSTAVPSTDFTIEETTLNMDSGASIDYVASPAIDFFVGDTISTNALGDAGSLCFQIKSDVQGVLSMREITFFIQA